MRCKLRMVVYLNVLLIILFSSLVMWCKTQKTFGAENTASQFIDTSLEYVNGSIPIPIGGIWYVWVNVSTTQVIHYSLFSNEVNSPVINFLGQHLQLENGTEVFIGRTLSLIEVYSDANGDGIPQANFTSGETEIAYYLLVNSSIGYEIAPIQKVLDNEIPHYKWGFKYDMIDGFLLYPEQQPGNAAAMVMIDHLGFYYDFYVIGNLSYIKESFHIGNITEIQPSSGEVSLEGLSFSLLFSTVTISDTPYSAYVNGEPYNSTTAENPAIETMNGEVAVGTIKAYEFLFGENYNLIRGENIETYQVKSEAAATTSVPSGVLFRLEWMLTHCENNLNVSALFPSMGGIGGKIELDCNASALLYRICYPVWDGLEIKHDPTYIAYLFSDIIIPEFSLAKILLIQVILTSLVMLAKKIHKHQT